MTILFATNDAGDVAGAVGNNATAGNFDSDFVDSAIEMTNTSGGANAFRVAHYVDVSAESEVWFHFDFNLETTFTSSADGFWLRLIERSTGNVALTLDVNNGYIEIDVYNNASSVATSGNFTLAPDIVYTMDIKYEDDGTDVTAIVYLDDVSVATATLGASGGKRMPDILELSHVDFIQSNSPSFYSQFIFAAAESTVGLKMRVLDPSTIGNHTDMSSTVTEISDDSRATGYKSVTNGDKNSWNPEAYTAPAGTVIHSLLPQLKLRTGTTGPVNVRQFIRHTAVDYNADSADQTTIDQVAVIADQWANNPDDAAAWDAADIADIEVGFEVKT